MTDYTKQLFSMTYQTILAQVICVLLMGLGMFMETLTGHPAWFGLTMVALLGVILFFLCWFYQRDIILTGYAHSLEIERHQYGIAYTPKPTRVPMPPLAFVNFLNTFHDAQGRLPTLDECVSGMSMQDNALNRGQVQAWYVILVRVGAVVGRREGVSTGSLSPDWTWGRMRQAASDDMTTPLPMAESEI